MSLRCFACLTVAAALVCPVMASAADEKKAPDLEKIFKRKDANSDGMLTLDEFKAGLKDKALETADKRFGRIDSNSDGKLTLDEFKAGMTPKNK